MCIMHFIKNLFNVMHFRNLKGFEFINRIVDNSKILSLCNMKQSDLMPLCEELKTELENISPESIKMNEYINKHMDEYLEKLI